MKLIIDIPENLYKWIKDEYDNPNEEVAYSAIENGTPVSTGGDLISREALKKSFEDTVCIEPMPYAFVKQIIDNAPTVELTETEIQETLNKRCMTAVANEYLTALHGKRPQGEWIENSDKLGLSYMCPFCGHEITGIPQDLNYCCKCGADMRGKEE